MSFVLQHSPLKVDASFASDSVKISLVLFAAIQATNPSSESSKSDTCPTHLIYPQFGMSHCDEDEHVSREEKKS